MKGLLFPCVLILIGGCQTHTASKDPACDAALAWLVSQSHDRSGREIIVSTGDEESLGQMNPMLTAAKFEKGGVTAAMVERLIESGGKSALTACPALAGELSKRHIQHERDGKSRPPVNMDPDNSQDWGMEFVQATRAVVSDDGSQALLATGSVIGPEAGSGTIVHMQRGLDGSWHEVDTIPTWIS